MLNKVRIFIFLPLLLQGSLNGRKLEKRMEDWQGIIVKPYWRDYPQSVGRSRSELPELQINQEAHAWVPVGGFDTFLNKFRDISAKHPNVKKISDIISRLAVMPLGMAVSDSQPASINIKSAVSRLLLFYGRELLPLFMKEFTDQWGNASREEEGAACLESLEKILDLYRGGDYFPKEDFILVTDALYALKLLYEYDFIRYSQVKDLFKSERIIESIGRHLVHCHGKKYPDVSGFKNFIPDMDFLKEDSQTSEIHWLLRVLDKPTEGKVLLKSMQEYFSNMETRATRGNLPSMKWATLLDNMFYQEFEWIHSSTTTSQEQLEFLSVYVINILQNKLTTTSLEEVLSNFWIIKFILKYNANKVNQEIVNTNYNILLQHSLIEKILEIQT
ncbi:hypothetical protein PTTG_12125, partial [Puccinia triticina 1-1 BBBD Race 1]